MHVSRFLTTTLLATLTATAAIAGDKAIIVMDGSGSMWGQIDGKTKIEIARETLGTVLGTVPADTELGLIAYGHREKGACSDIEQIVSPGTGNRDAIAAAVNGLNPKGKTPLSASVRMAAEALKFTEDKATVILVTDGLETCEADPCAVATELEQAGVDFTAHVVGFGLTEDEGKQVACLAENTGGKFIQAKDAGELSDALTQTVAAAPEPAPEPAPAPEPEAVTDNVTFRVRIAEGAPEYDLNGRWEIFPMNGDTPSDKYVEGSYGTNFTTTLEPGRYMLRYDKDIAEVETIFEVLPGEKIDRELYLNAGIAKLSIAPAEGAEVSGNGRIDIKMGKSEIGSYGPMDDFVPAGTYEVTGNIGKAVFKDTVTIEAGKATEKTFIVPAGRLTVDAVYNDGGEKVDTSSMRHDVVSAKKSLDGKRKDWEGSYGNGDFMLPPGDYVIVSELGVAKAETAVTVEQNALTETTVNINAGIVVVTAPGAYRVDLLEAKADMEGKHKRLEGNYGEEMQVFASPGDYQVRVEYEGDKAPVEKIVTVKAGERTEENIQ